MSYTLDDIKNIELFENETGVFFIEKTNNYKVYLDGKRKWKDEDIFSTIHNGGKMIYKKKNRIGGKEI
jgi:hypothetical protein